MIDLTFGSVASYTGLICLWIVVIWQLVDWKKRKRDGTFEYILKDPWWKKTYIWQIFFRRAFYRPIASSLPYLLFVIPAIFMVFFYLNGLLGIAINGKAKKLEEMHHISGIVTKIHVGRGKNSYDFIQIKDNNGNEDIYRLSQNFLHHEAEEFKEKIQNTKTRVDIWYQDMWYLESYKQMWELKVDDEYVKLDNKIKFKYDYEWFVQRDKNAITNLLWWLNYSLFGWFWLWFLNRKELPIHRQNKQMHYEKYNLKDK